jgi:hypothetical protein
MARWKTAGWRVLRVAVVPLLCVAGLAAAQPAGATATPPTADPALIGTWLNIDAATSDIKEVVVTSDGSGGLLVDAFGACTPELCELGQVPAVIYAPPGSTSPGQTFATNEDRGYEHVALLGQLGVRRHAPTLSLSEYHTFTDGSGRKNFVSGEQFSLASPLGVGAAGTAATDYPGGDQPHPRSSLIGTWHNTDAAADGILELDISRAADGTLLVHELGVCHPDPCDNGTVAAIAFGSPAGSTSATRFLAPFEYPFQRELDAAAVRGHILHVTEYFEFTDGSGRPNITQTETFTQ